MFIEQHHRKSFRNKSFFSNIAFFKKLIPRKRKKDIFQFLQGLLSLHFISFKKKKYNINHDNTNSNNYNRSTTKERQQQQWNLSRSHPGSHLEESCSHLSGVFSSCSQDITRLLGFGGKRQQGKRTEFTYHPGIFQLLRK